MFFLLGAHKSGTTDLFHRITAHPSILRPRNKESNYWCDVSEQRAMKTYGNTSRAGQRLLADGTPRTLMCRLPLMPAMLRRVHGDALRVVILTRDPVERAWSEFKYFAIFQRLFNKRCYYDPGNYGSGLIRKPNASHTALWSTNFSVLEAFDRSVRKQAAHIDRCEVSGGGWKLSRECHGLCKLQLSRDPWNTCPLPRLLPGLIDPIVRVWRDALPPQGLQVVDASAFLIQPEAFLSQVFAFLGVRPLSEVEMRAVVALPTSEAATPTKLTNVDEPWHAVHKERPFANTSEFLSSWYRSKANRPGCWEK